MTVDVNKNRSAPGDTALHRLAVQSPDDPGALGPLRGWLDTSGPFPVLKMRDLENLEWIPLNPAVIQDAKAAVQYATAAALPANTYANGAAGIGATLTGNANGALAAVDGHVINTLGTRLLVKNEAAPAHNGLYTLSTAGDAGSPYVLTRAIDADLASQLGPGIVVAVEGPAGAGGATNDGTLWISIAARPFVTGTTGITFGKIGALGELLAANNLSDLASAAAARGNLGLGDAAVQNVADFMANNNAVRKTANYAMTAHDTVVIADATAGTFTVTLPAPSYNWQRYTVVKIDATANVVAVDGNGFNINGAPGPIALRQPFEVLSFVYQAGWWTLAPVRPLLAANNLVDLPSPAAARGNLGLGDAATQNVADFMNNNNNTRKTANYAMTAHDTVVLANAVAGGFTVTLPAPSYQWERYTVKKIDASANLVHVDGAGFPIDGNAGGVDLVAQWDSLDFTYNGGAWFIL